MEKEIQHLFHVVMIQRNNLIKKYNINVPRYTSYPPVPSWNEKLFSAQNYLIELKESFKNNSNGVSLYIHLPYCESLCTYCGCNTRITINHNVELPYINALLKEWRMYVEFFVKKPTLSQVHLGGGTPTFFSPNNLIYLITEIKKISPFTENGEFSFEGHPNNTSFEHLKTLSDLGFNRVSFGVQDFNEKVQVAINRIQPIENVQQVINWSRQLTYDSVNVDLVYGLPFQTKDSVKETIKKTLLLSPDRIAFYSYGHVPWVKPGQRKFTDDDIPKDSLKRELFEIGKNLFLQNGYLQLGLDHFAKPNDELSIAFKNGRLGRNFMGYTVRKSDFLIGIGVSSISESNIGYAQNEKTVESYLQKIENGKFPISKGHLLTTDDIKIKSLTTDLMCNFSCLLEEELILNPKIIEALSELKKDNLIELNSPQLIVTEKGKPFIRNICSVFDSYFQEQKIIGRSTTYSKSV